MIASRRESMPRTRNEFPAMTSYERNITMTTEQATTTATTAPSMDEVMEFAFKVVNELGAAMAGAHVYIGDRMDLFKTLASGGR